MNTRTLSFLLAGAAVWPAGCTTTPDPEVTSSQANVSGQISYGSVVGVKPAVIQGKGFYMPGMGLTGPAMTKAISAKRAQEITIQMEGGDRRAVVIVQESPPDFVAGDRVMIVVTGGRAKVEYAPFDAPPPDTSGARPR
ncbi:MAG: hypothetical protein A3G75_14775 [Verrucomicrobia bacterium RIFCSPLOWO2_12_FULL_64_8]|nr:MAG: hypothetical protein A3G75_14775 [Verrucomicrobia bacterium RIFCSPLOWO2_12_FULL_64_8]